MWDSVICSSRGLLLLLTALALGSASAPGARAEVFLTADRAVAEAFPDSELEKITLYLKEEEVAAIQKIARAKQESRIVTRIKATKAGVVTGYGYFDTHVVRTMPETILVVLQADGAVRQVLILAFAEPDDYRPRPRWLATLEGRRLDPELWPGRGVPRISGATLTTQAITDATRRVLALHQVTAGGGAAP